MTTTTNNFSVTTPRPTTFSTTETVATITNNSTATTPRPTTSNSTETIATTTNIVIAVLVAVIVLIIILSVTVIICVVRKRSQKHTLTFTGTNDVSMYASPAYGTHHVFTEPGMDHLYEPIDESYREKSTTLQDAPQADDDEAGIDYIKMNPSFKAVDQTTEETAANVDDYINPSFKAADQAFTEETDVENYIKMNSSGKVVDQVVSGETETDVDDYMEMNQSFKVVDQTATDEYIQAAGDKDILPTGNDNQ